jgi:putative ABC transport system ATP-binding protein
MGVIELKGITYAYTKDRPVLKGIDAVFDAGKMYVLFGPSGCGKTTLLSLLGGLDIPSGGSVFYDGEDIRDIGLENHRRKNVSFIFQNYNLIDYMTALENVLLTAKEDPLPVL